MNVSFLFFPLDAEALRRFDIAISTARVLTQALSNMVTTNNSLIATLWGSYMNLPEDQVVLMFV